MPANMQRQPASIIRAAVRNAQLWLAPLCLSCFASMALSQDDPLAVLHSNKIHDASQDFTEPSGIALAQDGKTLLAVSDNVNAIFTLDQAGKVLGRLDLSFDAKDLEGIAISLDGQLLALQEGLHTILVIDPDGGGVRRTVRLRDLAGHAGLAQHLTGAPKSKGYEGIAVHPVTGTVYVIHEGQPRVLLEIDPDLSAVLRGWLLGPTIGFFSPHANDKDLDVSGLAVDGRTGHVLIVSDTGKSLFELNLDTLETRRFQLNRNQKSGSKPLKNAEGVALDQDTGRLFVVTDDGKSSRMQVYGFPN